MGMDVWVNVLTMPFLSADSKPWRTMSRAWPAMSAITTSSDSTCPSHQESAWGTVEAIQEKVIVQAVRKGIVVWKCWSMCWRHLQMYFVSTVLGEQSSDVEQSWGASAKLPGRRPPPHWTVRAAVNKGIVFGELNVFFLPVWVEHFYCCCFCRFLGVCMGAWEWMCEWTSWQCHSWAQTLDRGERCLGPDLQCPR